MPVAARCSVWGALAPITIAVPAAHSASAQARAASAPPARRKEMTTGARRSAPRAPSSLTPTRSRARGARSTAPQTSPTPTSSSPPFPIRKPRPSLPGAVGSRAGGDPASHAASARPRINRPAAAIRRSRSSSRSAPARARQSIPRVLDSGVPGVMGVAGVLHLHREEQDLQFVAEPILPLIDAAHRGTCRPRRGAGGRVKRKRRGTSAR